MPKVGTLRGNNYKRLQIITKRPTRDFGRPAAAARRVAATIRTVATRGAASPNVASRPDRVRIGKPASPRRLAAAKRRVATTIRTVATSCAASPSVASRPDRGRISRRPGPK